MFFKNKLLIISNLILCILVIFFFKVEYQYSPDVRRNIQFAEFFIENNFNLVELVRYLIDARSIEFNIIIAILIYSVGLVIGNLAVTFFILNFIITIFLFFLVKKDFDEKKINIFYFHVFSYVYLLNPDLRLWQSFLLFDYFCAILIFIYFRFLIKEKFLISSVFLILLLLLRPTSVFILPIILLYIFFRYVYKTKNSIQINFLIFITIAAFICFSLIFIYVDDLGFISPRLNYYKDFNLEGLVVHDRWSIDFEINSVFKLIILFLIKFFAFHQFISSDFSLIHNLYNFAYYTPYILTFLFIFIKIYLKDDFSFNKYYLLSFYFVVIYSLSHSIFLIDYDFRYRTPLYIPVIISIIYFLHENNFHNFLKRKIKFLLK